MAIEDTLWNIAYVLLLPGMITAVWNFFWPHWLIALVGTTTWVLIIVFTMLSFIASSGDHGEWAD